MRRETRFSRGVLLTLTLLVAVPVAAASASFAIGTPSLDNQTAEARKNDLADGRSDLKCPSGYRARGLKVIGAHWGTYPSITWAALRCKSPSGDKVTRQWGVASGRTEYQGEVRKCSGTNPALDGVRVGTERYVEDFKIRCAEIRVSGGTATVDDDGYHGGWLLGRIQPRNEEYSLRCPDGAVVTGLRFQYREDSDERAITSVRLWCAEVAA